MKRKMRHFISLMLKKHRKRAIIQMWDKEDRELKEHYKSPSLTRKEKQELKQYWKQYTNESIPTTYYEVAKGIDKFSTDYISHSIYFAYLLPVLNPREEASALANKGMYSFFFKDVYRPKEIAKNIHGNYYNEDNQLCTRKEAIAAILNYKKEIIVKPSIDSSRGRNVIILSDYTGEEIGRIFDKYSKDFVVQEVIKQSEQTAKFNPTSLNTFRITTLLLNGKYSCLSIIFRNGGLNSIVDNVNAGGIMTGVHPNGAFYQYGFNKQGEKCTSSYNNTQFAGNKIKNFEHILDFVHTLHLRLPFCSVVGWDIAIDHNENPILIEVNLKGPSIDVEQLCSGPAFGERTQEVLNYVFNK